MEDVHQRARFPYSFPAINGKSMVTVGGTLDIAGQFFTLKAPQDLRKS
jgi:hypothetical protein